MAGSRTWKKGRGKLGPMTPLLGTWRATADSPMGTVKCTRTFTEALGGKYVVLDCEWRFGKTAYTEHAVFGLKDGALSFWSFTSDGKNSSGISGPAPDIHKDALCFEADMPAGRARQVYWPNDVGGSDRAVESKSKKGWKRSTHHRYGRG
jgi:hypothetical protein